MKITIDTSEIAKKIKKNLPKVMPPVGMAGKMMGKAIKNKADMMAIKNKAKK